MKKLLLPIALVCAAVPAAAAERRFSVTDFDRVRVEGPFEVTLRTGLPSGAVAEGNGRALDRVDIEVQGRLLKIRSRSSWGGYPGEQPGPVAIALTTRDLRGVSLQGNGSLAIDKVRGLMFELSLNGNGRIAIERLEADRADVGLLGTGAIRLAGAVKTFKASIQGTGDLDAANLRADDATIIAGTSGAIAVEAVRTAKVDALGAGDVTISGDPACTVSNRGNGRVLCGR